MLVHDRDGAMSESAGWRVTLGCGCVWRFTNPPDLHAPYFCTVDKHGWVSVMSAERVEK